MTEEQRAAYINAQTACALIEMEGMRAANAQRLSLGQSAAYDEKAFTDLIVSYGIHNNGVLGFFQS